MRESNGEQPRYDSFRSLSVSRWIVARILAVSICSVAVLAGCKQSIESSLVGAWRMRSVDDAGQIDYGKDHTFTWREWPVTNTDQPALLFDTGEWRLHGNKLIMDFKGAGRPPDAKHAEFSLARFDDDHFVIRKSNTAAAITLERMK